MDHHRCRETGMEPERSGSKLCQLREVQKLHSIIEGTTNGNRLYPPKLTQINRRYCRQQYLQILLGYKEFIRL